MPTQRRLGFGSQRSGSQSTKADQASAKRKPPRTSLGQWSPAQIQVSLRLYDFDVPVSKRDWPPNRTSWPDTGSYSTTLDVKTLAT